MGLIGQDELEAVQVAVNPTAGSSFGEFTADTIKTSTPQAMISENGVRSPSHEDAQNAGKALRVVISTQKLEREKIDAIHSNLENYSRSAAPDATWGGANNFWLATHGKASFDFEVIPQYIK